MILSKVLVVLSATLAASSPVLHFAEETQDVADSNFGARNVIDARGSDAERSSAAATPAATAAAQVTGGEPLPKGGALDVGWVTPGSQAFIDISLYHHNVHRANHSAPFVSWNNTLYLWAQKKADTCQYNENGLPGWDSVGMNIAGGTYGYPKQLPNPSGMISGLWYNSEEMNYPAYGVGNPNYNNFESWGHFSQLVWPTSHQIGCGLQNCGNSWFGLCLYSPPGNWDGEFNIIGRPRGYPPVYPNGQTHM